LFTGIVEAVGTLVEVAPRTGSTRLAISSSLPLEELRCGDSVAVDGVCLTIRERRDDCFLVDAVAETLARTTLVEARPGRLVHLERALRLADRLGGHLVQGHVDAVVPVLSVTRAGDDHRLQLALVPEVRRFIARKGSVALAGVSLTVAELEPDAFEVVLVPYTLAVTTFGRLDAGALLNLEVDLVARYLERLMDPALSGPARATGGGARRRRHHV